MKYYILAKNTVMNRGKVIIAGPFDTQKEADDEVLAKGNQWGSVSVELLSDDLAEQLTN